jgi:hypothetical protein
VCESEKEATIRTIGTRRSFKFQEKLGWPISSESNKLRVEKFHTQTCENDTFACEIHTHGCRF